MPLRACAMDWGRNRILRVGKNSRTILSRLWTKVHETMGQRRNRLYVPKSLPDCMSYFLQNVFATEASCYRRPGAAPKHFEVFTLGPCSARQEAEQR